MLKVLVLIAIHLLFISFAQEALSNPKCNGWMDPGTCHNYSVQWYYDRYDHRCRRFHYSGCGGNENRFNSFEECSSQCHFVEPGAEQRCSQPHDPGDCQADIERWYFDWNTKRCVCSWWSGCGGNSNRFFSYNHCMLICGDHAQGGPAVDFTYWGKRNSSEISEESRQVLEHFQSAIDNQDIEYSSDYDLSDIDPRQGLGELRDGPSNRLHGQTIFRHDAGPIVKRNPDGSTTTTHRFFIVHGNESPVQTLPGMVAIPASQNAIHNRRRLIKIKKKKIPPRQLIPLPQQPAQPSQYQPRAPLRHRQDSHPQNHLSTTPSPHFYYTYRPDQQVHQNLRQRQQAFPTQVYATYKVDRQGRMLNSQRVTWTGTGTMPVDALRRQFPEWTPPNEYEMATYLRNQHGRSSSAPKYVPAVPPTHALPTSPPVPPTRRAVPLPTSYRTPAFQYVRPTLPQIPLPKPTRPHTLPVTRPTTTTTTTTTPAPTTTTTTTTTTTRPPPTRPYYDRRYEHPVTDGPPRPVQVHPAVVDMTTVDPRIQQPRTTRIVEADVVQHDRSSQQRINISPIQKTKQEELDQIFTFTALDDVDDTEYEEYEVYDTEPTMPPTTTAQPTRPPYRAPPRAPQPAQSQGSWKAIVLPPNPADDMEIDIQTNYHLD